MDSLKWMFCFVCFCQKGMMHFLYHTFILVTQTSRHAVFFSLPLFLFHLNPISSGFTAVTQIEASFWTITVPSSIEGLPGSCVVIPCSYNVPNPENKVTQFTGMWFDEANHLVYHPVESEIQQRFQHRTKLVGDVKRWNCSLKIDPLEPHDEGPFHFRIEIADYDSFSYKQNKIFIKMISEVRPITFSVKEVTEGQAMSASCSVSHTCPTSPPVFTWSHSGQAHAQSQQLEGGQWRATSVLTFHPTRTDNNKSLQCTARFKGGRDQKASKVLKVQYAPVGVKVECKSDVKEGEDVQLKCSSDAHPPARRYEWHNEAGSQLHQGQVFMLPNVSRHTGAFYCTAMNSVGQGKSSLVHLNVLYAPEVKSTSSCSIIENMIECVCIVESNPPSTVHFMLSGRALQSATVKKNSVTIRTPQAELESYEFVLCLANNTQGNANLTLFLPVHSKMQSLHIIIIIGAGLILLILLITLGVVKKCRARSGTPTPHMSNMGADKDQEIPHHAATKRPDTAHDDDNHPNMYADYPVYGNMETDWDEAIYANM